MFLSSDEGIERFSSTNALTWWKIILCDGVIAGRVRMSEDGRRTETQPTDRGVGALDGFRVLLLLPFDPVCIAILALEDLFVPFLHLIEEHLQAYGVDSAALVEIPA